MDKVFIFRAYLRRIFTYPAKGCQPLDMFHLFQLTRLSTSYVARTPRPRKDFPLQLLPIPCIMPHFPDLCSSILPAFKLIHTQATGQIFSTNSGYKGDIVEKPISDLMNEPVSANSNFRCASTLAILQDGIQRDASPLRHLPIARVSF